MNFFEAQKSARRRTGFLLLLFVLAVSGLLLLSNLFLYEFIFASQAGGLAFTADELSQVYDPDLTLMLSAAVLLFIVLGSVYKLFSLSAGGVAIAESLGGVHVPRSSQDPLYRKILNIVEEMAIASGSPVPQVYVLNESGINAFAAGWKTTDVVIGITRGALESLNREELQGVIAHEFSHIFNGDMRLNIRLIAILHGILMIGLTGKMIMRSLRYVGRSRNSKSGQGVVVILAIGSVLMIIGYTGMFFGNWIKALISRQREYLADASAVQFTRNNEGIANALKKIGGAVYGSSLMAASADEYSHAYFARGAQGVQLFNFSTHPPLPLRIKRIQPGWDGRFIAPENKAKQEEMSPADQDSGRFNERQQQAMQAGAVIATTVMDGASAGQVKQSLDSIGDISQQRVDAAREKQLLLPAAIKTQAENPYGAQLLILVILLDKDDEVRNSQLAQLESRFDSSHRQNAASLWQDVKKLHAEQILPLIDLAMPTLREMTSEQYLTFKQLVREFIAADKKVSLREWVIQRVVLQHLDDSFGLRSIPVARYFVLGSAKASCETVLSLLAYVEHKKTGDVEKAFSDAVKEIGAGALRLRPKAEISLKQLDAAMDDIVLLKYPLKKRFLQACVACITSDGKVTVKGYELLRAIASCLDIPVPPL